MAELEDAVGSSAELIKGANGVFDVTFDGELVFSKHKEGRFPESGEVSKRIAASQV